MKEEITKYIQKLEARYEKVKNEKTYYDSDECYRQGQESELEDVIDELKKLLNSKKINQ